VELGALELWIATKNDQYLVDAAMWAYEYIHNASSTDTINLYDVSGLAHYELYRAIIGNTITSEHSHLAVSPQDLLKSMKAQLDQGVSQANSDPFGLGVAYAAGDDVVPHAFGYWLESLLYLRLTGNTNTSQDYLNLAVSQRNFVFGCNAWGTSFIVGDNSEVFPHCMQHQVANLAGSLNGTSYGSLSILYGATVDGPSNETNFNGLGIPSPALPCPNPFEDPFKEFTGEGARYEDNVVAWPSVEPADDYTVLPLLTFSVARMNQIK